MTLEEQILGDIEAQQEAGDEAMTYAIENIPKNVEFWHGWVERGKAIINAFEAARLDRLVSESMRCKNAQLESQIESLEKRLKQAQSGGRFKSLKAELREARVESSYYQALWFLERGGTLKNTTTKAGRIRWYITGIPPAGRLLSAAVYRRLKEEGMIKKDMSEDVWRIAA